MKPIELIKILDSGVVKELTIYYCGGHITVEKDSCPFELPDYDICKLWNSENGRGISVLLADNVTKEETTSKERRAAAVGGSSTTPDLKTITDGDAETALYVLKEYCAKQCSCFDCIFKKETTCQIPKTIYDYDFKKKKGGKE